MTMGTAHDSFVASGFDSFVRSSVDPEARGQVGGALYWIGGSFSGTNNPGAIAANKVIVWDASTGDWSQREGLPVANRVTAIAEFNGEVYVSLQGRLGSNELVYKWNGSTWVSTGNVGFTQDAYSLAVYGNFLYLGLVSVFNGSSWTLLPVADRRSGFALAVYDGLLWGGESTSPYFNSYNGSATSSEKNNATFGPGTDDQKMAAGTSAVYASGIISGSVYQLISKPSSGNNWSADPDVQDVEGVHFRSSDGLVYIGGKIISGALRGLLVKDGSWSRIVDVGAKVIRAFAESDEGLLFGGQFTNGIKLWDGVTARDLGFGLNGQVYSILVTNK